MAEAGWSPSEEEFRSGQEAYIRYLGGVSVLHDPTSVFAQNFHQIGQDELDQEHHVERTLIQAERIIYPSLRAIVKISSSPEERGGSSIDENFPYALPHMRRIVDETFEVWESRLTDLDIVSRTYRPAPFTDPTVYGYLARPRKEKIHTIRLLDGVPNARVFDTKLSGRTIGHL